ncbi:MAG: radical SAM protein [Bacteroidetes bacterium]|nr:MAG: radical SAM protein [Bacteroidota bacterium]
MKILLINPPPYKHGENSRFLERTPIQTYTMPLGIGYIASVLEREGQEVSILDAYAKNYSDEKIVELIKNQKPDIIGIQCLSDQRVSWFKLINLIRAVDNTIKIVLGGPHPALMLSQVLTNFSPDAIVIGEGEETMLELVRTWENKGELSKVKGIAYLKGKNVVITSPRERIKDLDSLPFPAYHMVNLNDYSGWDFMAGLYSILGLNKPPKYASISTSRGCVGDCGYCSAPLIWKRRWTKRSAINVVDEMEMLSREYGVEFIILTDDIFTVNQERVMSICKEIPRRNLKLLWGFETAVNFVSSELLNLAKQAGCCCILYGVESGSKTVLSNISKKIKEEDVVNAFKMTKDAGIIAGAFLMVGNPGEDEKSINATINLLRRIKPDIILPQIAMITPGTKIYDIAKEKGFIDESYWLTDLPFPYYICERKLKTLLRWYKKLFYYRHGNLGILLRTTRDYIELHTGIRISKKGFVRVEIPS